jgi:hypothetical protein
MNCEKGQDTINIDANSGTSRLQCDGKAALARTRQHGRRDGPIFGLPGRFENTSNG